MASASQLRDYLFRGLLLDAEGQKFRSAGITFGVESAQAEADLLKEAILPFSLALRTDALFMSRLYALIFCFENSVRDLIAKRLAENCGPNWWEDKVPGKVKSYAADRQNDAIKNSWLEGVKKDPMQFIMFGQLSDIITQNWPLFDDLIPSQHWLKQRFEELEKARNFIAHNRVLSPSEVQRIEMYINDWNKVVGL
jgi:hypothetical protein